MRQSEKISFLSLVACLIMAHQFSIYEGEMIKRGLIVNEDIRIFPLLFLTISAFAAIYTGITPPAQFSVYTIKCLRCQKEYSSRSSLKTELWNLQHRLCLHARKEGS